MTKENWKLNIQLFGDSPEDTTTTNADVEEKDIEKTIVDETDVDKTKVDETKEVLDKFDIDYSQFENLGTAEEVQSFLKDELPNDLSERERDMLMKVFKKMNEQAKETDDDTEKQDVSDSEAIKVEVMDNLPMSNKEFKDLHSWVGKQPKEYREKLAELTDYSSKSKEEILEAITQANEDRKKSVGGAVRIDTAGGSFSPTTKDTILDEYTTILKTYYGQEQKNKIKELKNSSLSATKGELNDWVKSFL